MVRNLVEANGVLRIAQQGQRINRDGRDWVHSLLRRKETVRIVAQVMDEFWVVATRPMANHGLGMTPETVRRKLEKAESFFELLPDTAAIYGEWRISLLSYADASSLHSRASSRAFRRRCCGEPARSRGWSCLSKQLFEILPLVTPVC